MRERLILLSGLWLSMTGLANGFPEFEWTKKFVAKGWQMGISELAVPAFFSSLKACSRVFGDESQFYSNSVPFVSLNGDHGVGYLAIVGDHVTGVTQLPGRDKIQNPFSMIPFTDKTSLNVISLSSQMAALVTTERGTGQYVVYYWNLVKNDLTGKAFKLDKDAGTFFYKIEPGKNGQAFIAHDQGIGISSLLADGTLSYHVEVPGKVDRVHDLGQGKLLLNCRSTVYFGHVSTTRERNKFIIEQQFSAPADRHFNTLHFTSLEDPEWGTLAALFTTDGYHSEISVYRANGQLHAKVAVEAELSSVLFLAGSRSLIAFSNQPTRNGGGDTYLYRFDLEATALVKNGNRLKLSGDGFPLPMNPADLKNGTMALAFHRRNPGLHSTGLRIVGLSEKGLSRLAEFQTPDFWNLDFFGMVNPN